MGLILFLVLTYLICRVIKLFIPYIVPEIYVDTSDVIAQGRQPGEDSYIYVPRKRKDSGEDKVHCYDPATMKYLGLVPALKFEEVRDHVNQARQAQKEWAKSTFKERRHLLRIMLKYILDHQELICEVSARDSGKTMTDAALGEILTTCEKISWLLDEGERWLKPEYRRPDLVEYLEMREKGFLVCAKKNEVKNKFKLATPCNPYGISTIEQGDQDTEDHPPACTLLP